MNIYIKCRLLLVAALMILPLQLLAQDAGDKINLNQEPADISNESDVNQDTNSASEDNPSGSSAVVEEPKPAEDKLPWQMTDEEKKAKEAAEKQKQIEAELKKKEEEERLKREKEEKEKAEKEKAAEKESKLLLRVVYDKDTIDIPEAEKTNLDKIVETLKASPQKRLSIWAYSSFREGQPSEARRYSLKRAIEIREYFIIKGIDKMRMNIRALGESGDDAPKDRIDISLID